jgi:phage terminase large subunit-like protein
MNMQKWSSCGVSEKRPMPDFRKKLCVPGLDLSSVLDLTSVGFEIPVSKDESVVLSHSFIPEEKIAEKIKTDRMPFDLWVRDGWITPVPGPIIEYHYVYNYIKEQFKANEWRKGEICFDRALATWLTFEVEKMSFVAVEVPQSYTGLSEATKDFRARVVSRKIYHDNNPVLAWAISNAVVRKGPSENIMLDKSRAVQRIDPIAAQINAHARAMVLSAKPKPVMVVA